MRRTDTAKPSELDGTGPAADTGSPQLALDLAPLVAQEVVRLLYADEWLDVHQVVDLVKLSRSRLDDLKFLGRFPEADRWVAGKQVWSRLTVEGWKRGYGQNDRAADLTDADHQLLRQLRRERRCSRDSQER